MTKAAVVGTGEVMDALRAKYAARDERAWAGGFYLEECGINGQALHDGQPTNRRCDALYAGFTSASGRTLIGHEVKVSRSDWLGELKKVGKADFWHDNCHQWYVVAPRGIVEHPELPEGWGLLELQGSRLITAVKARARIVTPSWDALRSILSRAETLRAESVGRALQRARDDVRREISELQYQLSMTEQNGGLGRGAGAERVRRVLARVQAERSGEGIFGEIDEEVVVRTILDAESVRVATESARRQLEQRLNEINRLSRGLTQSYGPLGKILKEMI